MASLLVFQEPDTDFVLLEWPGPVVIPLLRGYIVETGLVSSRDFLLGFAVLQGAPGPNFSYVRRTTCPSSLVYMLT